ncbi:hypothetical protein ACSQ67_022087 [Phaseolus vulgaris]
MDFHSLARKQLQALCKKNKIPANITNVAMADALAALDQVEGLDEILNSIEADVGTPSVQCRTAGRAASQRKAARAEAEDSTAKVSASARPLRGARGGVASGVMEQENKDANVPPVTPAVGRRRATAVSTRRKKEVEMVEQEGDKNDAPKTLAAASVGGRRTTSRSVCTTKIETPGGASVQRTYSTRRSVRLLENGLSKMNLIDTEDTGFDKIDDDDDVSQELSNVSHKAGDSCDTEQGSSLQMDSSVVSENTQEFEVCSSEHNTEYECQSHVSGSDVKLVSVTENNAVVQPHALDEAEPEKINCLEMGTEPNASDEAGSEPLPDLEETCDSSELETENKDCLGAYQESFPVEASTDASVEVTGLEKASTDIESDNISVAVTDQGVASSLMVTDCKIYDQVSNKGGDQDVNNDGLVSLKELVELMDEEISHEGDDKEEKKNEPEEDVKSNDLSLLQGSSDSCDKSDDQGSEVLPVPEEISVDIVPSETSEDALVLVTDQDTATLTLEEVADEDVTVSDAPTDINESVEYNTGDANQDMKDETEHLNLACGNMADEDYQHPITVDEKDTKESDSMIGSEGVPELESISNSAGELQKEELKEAKPEQIEESEEPVAEQVSVESASGPLDGELSSKSNVPTDGEVVSQDVTVVSSDVPVQSVVSNSLKENLTSDDLHKKTMGELKRMLKGLNLGGEKSNCNKTISKEVDKKRTALQVLPQNQMTSGEAQIED